MRTHGDPAGAALIGPVDWVTTSALATAGGTLVLSVATFASVRSANRAARTAERSLLAGLRPLLVPSRLQDPPQKVSFVDQRWLRVDGGHGVTEVSSDAVYMAISLRNVGSGIGVLHGWQFYPGRVAGDVAMPDVPRFHRLTRDLYVAAGDNGFWQAAFRDPTADDFLSARDAIAKREGLTVDLLYGDLEGGQRSITRFALLPVGDDGWLAAASRHWNLDQPQPRT